MCFEFEYLYWAKLEEEVRQRKEEEERKRRQQAAPPVKEPAQRPQEPLPA